MNWKSPLLCLQTCHGGVYTLWLWCVRGILRTLRNPGMIPAGGFMHPTSSTMLNRPRERVQTRYFFSFYLFFSLYFGMCRRIEYGFDWGCDPYIGCYFCPCFASCSRCKFLNCINLTTSSPSLAYCVERDAKENREKMTTWNPGFEKHVLLVV